MIDQPNNAIHDPIGQLAPARCPHLGTQRDGDTWLSFPTGENHCHKASPPQSINLDYQGTHCLAAAYGECPVYQAKRARWVGPLPRGIRGGFNLLTDVFTTRNFLIVGGLIGTLAVLAFLAFMILPRFLNTTPTPPPTVPVVTVEVTATPESTLETQAPTITATAATVTTAPTVATTAAVIGSDGTPTPTRPAIFASVAFETNLRDGPSTENEVLARIPGGTTFLVLGRDTLGVWLFVDVDDLGQGWVFAEQIEEDIEILTLPIIYMDGQPAATPTTSSGTSSSAAQLTSTATGTALPTLPRQFTVDMILDVEPDSCGTTDLVVFYEITVDDDIVIMERDDLTLTGTYDKFTGEFEVFAVYGPGRYQGVEDRITGTMVYKNLRVTIEAREEWSTTSAGCAPIWHLHGESDLV